MKPCLQGGGAQATLVSYSTYGDSTDKATMKFEDLWKKILDEYRAKQEFTTQIDNVLLGDNQLKNILGVNAESLNWSLLGQSGRNCYSSSVGNLAFCGYLELLSNGSDNSIYKLRVRYETKVKNTDKDSGQVNVIRKQDKNAEINHGNSTESTGKKVSHAKFESFESFNKNSDQNDGGLQVDGYSIKENVV